MAKLLAIILIVFLLLTPLLRDILYHYWYRPKNSTDPSYINNINFRTGDLVLYTWRNHSLFDTNKVTPYKFSLYAYLREIIPSLVNGQTTHIAVIIKLNNIPYVYDLNVDTDYMFNKNPDLLIPRYCNYLKKVVCLEPALLDINYLKYYGGHINILPYTGIDPTESDILKVLERNKVANLFVVDSIINKCIINKEHEWYKMSCSAFVAKVLSELNIIKFDNYYCTTPQSVRNKCVDYNKYDCSSNIFIDNGY
jgi:hypothetical protein